MKTYYVPFIATASHTVEVQADSAEEAIEKAMQEADHPFFPGGMSGDLGDWEPMEDEVEFE